MVLISSYLQELFNIANSCNASGLNYVKVKGNQLVMSVGSSFARADELPKIVGGLLCVCDPNADPNNTWYCFNVCTSVLLR